MSWRKNSSNVSRTALTIAKQIYKEAERYTNHYGLDCIILTYALTPRYTKSDLEALQSACSSLMTKKHSSLPRPFVEVAQKGEKVTIKMHNHSNGDMDRIREGLRQN